MNSIKVEDQRKAEPITDNTPKRNIGEDERLQFKVVGMKPRPTPPPEDTPDPSRAWADFRALELAWLHELAEHPHVQEVMNIPGDEPIFVLRSQDINAPETVDGWIAVAGRMINQSKFNSAVKRYKEMLEWQNVQPTRAKIPD